MPVAQLDCGPTLGQQTTIVERNNNAGHDYEEETKVDGDSSRDGRYTLDDDTITQELDPEETGDRGPGYSQGVRPSGLGGVDLDGSRRSVVIFSFGIFGFFFAPR